MFILVGDVIINSREIQFIRRCSSFVSITFKDGSTQYFNDITFQELINALFKEEI